MRTKARATLARLAGCMVILPVALGAHPVPAQVSPATDRPTGTPQQPEVRPGQPQVTEQVDMPVSVGLGLRASALLINRPAVSCVVIVEDEVSYLEAIAEWSPTLRFPVLYDDGTWQAREDLARFVRAYKPEHVITWESDRAGTRLPRREAFKGVADDAVARAWDQAGETAARQMVELWRAIGITPPGVIVASTTASTWTAAVALSAGRAQPIVWYEDAGNISQALELGGAQGLARFIGESCEALGLTWSSTGDEVDAVTLCLSIPIKVRTGERDLLATTEVVARVDGVPSGPRYAWGGVIFGSEARCAYSAMCSMFLSTSEAWLFDAYPASVPWTDYSTRPGADLFRSVGLSAVELDPADEGERSWDNVAGSPLGTSIIFMNTKGQRDFFELGGRHAPPGEIPFLIRPSVAHVIHSWSANQPGRRETVGGRWLERGVYCYYGSVQEPTLQGFVPPEKVAGRLLAGMPAAAACHFDDAPAWKCTLIGDPLTTLLRSISMSEEACPLSGAIDIETPLADDLKGERFAEGMRTLVLLGRDDDAARLARALLKDKPEAMTSDVAGAAMWALMRVGDRDTFVRCYRLLDHPLQADAQHRDALWAVAWPVVRTSTDRATAELLAQNVREDQLGDDSFRLARVLDSAIGPGAGQALINASRSRVTDDRERQRFDQDIRRLSGQPR